MGTAATMAYAQQAVNKAGTLAEAQAILNQLIAEEELVTDIFFQQEYTIQTLTDLLDEQDSEKPQPVYYSAQQTPPPRSRNYLMYIGIGIGILLLTGRLKL